MKALVRASNAGAPARPKVRIEEVAKLAQVSAATVSRALNNPGLVSTALREKVEAAAQSLSYVAHGAARALASRRSRAFGVLVPTFANTIFADAIAAFQRRLEAENYTMLLAAFDYDQEVEYRSARTMIERGVDGLMLVGVTHDARLFTLLEASAVPFVQTWAPAKDSPHPTIGYDNAALARMVVDHLVGLGHRDIGMVAGFTDNNDRVRSRIIGMRATLRRHKLPFTQSRIVFTEYRIEAVRAAFRELQQRGPLPTALVANNDIVGLGLLLEAQAQGIPVPQQLSIVGVGDLEIAANLHPALTTVRTPKHQIGTLAAEYLLARIHDRAFSLPAELPLELMVRGTTAQPPASRKDPSP